MIDAGSRSFARTAGWRHAHGDTVIRIAPFGGGGRWNPFAHVWRHHGLNAAALRALAGRWFPQVGEGALIASHVQEAFIGLLHALDDVLRADRIACLARLAPGDRASFPWTVPTPADLYMLCMHGERSEPGEPSERDADSATLMELLRCGHLKADARAALSGWLSLDETHRKRVWHELRLVLAIFADVGVQQATRGDDLAGVELGRATVYLDIPDHRRFVAGPLLDTFIAQWHERAGASAAATLIVHGIDEFPPLITLLPATDKSGYASNPLAVDVRCLATVRSLVRLRERYGEHTSSLLRRFDICVQHALCDITRARDELPALNDIDEAHTAPACGRRYISARATDLRRLGEGEQIVLSPSLKRPLQCRVARTRRKPLPPPTEHYQGDDMPIPKPLAVLFASLAAGCAAPPQIIYADEVDTGLCSRIPPKNRIRGVRMEACLGPHKFLLAENLFYGQAGQGSDKTTFTLAVQWPSLEPLPFGTDFHRTTETFLSNITIEIAHLDRRTDEDYAKILMGWKTNKSPDDQQRAFPAENIDLRTKGEPVHGLAPYYVNFDLLEQFYVRLYGENVYGGTPEANQDWYIRFDEAGIPSTFIACGSRLIQDGARIVDGRIVDARGEGRRSTCRHSFLIPKYKALVTVDYIRVLLPEWQRIEQRVRDILAEGDVT